jgi:hypothetical protein
MQRQQLQDALPDMRSILASRPHEPAHQGFIDSDEEEKTFRSVNFTEGGLGTRYYIGRMRKKWEEYMVSARTRDDVEAQHTLAKYLRSRDGKSPFPPHHRPFFAGPHTSSLVYHVGHAPSCKTLSTRSSGSTRMSLESTKSTKASDRAAGSKETIDFSPGKPLLPRPTSEHADTISTQDSVGDAGSHGPKVTRPRPVSADAATMSTQRYINHEEPHKNSASGALHPPTDYERLLQELEGDYRRRTMPRKADAAQRRLHLQSSLGSFTRTNTRRTLGSTIHSHVEDRDQQDTVSRNPQACGFDNQLNVFNPSALRPDPQQDLASLAAPSWYKSRSGNPDDQPMNTSGSASRPTYRRCDPPPRVALHTSSGLPWTDETVSDMWSAIGGTPSGGELGASESTSDNTPRSEGRGQGVFEVGTGREKLAAQIPSSVYSGIKGTMIDRARPVSRSSDVSRSERLFFGA